MPWRRVLSTWMFILLGAGATGIGMGLVLLQARLERDTLKEHVRIAEAQLTSFQSEHTRLMTEASARVTQAEEAEQTAHAQLDAYVGAQKLMETSLPLPSPDPRARRTWVETISIPLGISLRTPNLAPANANDQSITATINGTAQTAGDLWFSLTKYSDEGERGLLRQLTSTTTVRYRIGNRLLNGSRGLFQGDQTPAFVFRIEQHGVPQSLIWIRAISPLTEQRLLEILSTLTFAS